MRPVSRFARLALSSCFGAVLLSSAQAGVIEMIEPGQIPPKDEQAAPAEPPKCIEENAGFWQGKPPTFKYSLRNNCETRVRCTVSAYIVNSHGPTKGQSTLILEPKSKGAGSYKEWSLKLKEPGGMANASRKCVDI